MDTLCHKSSVDAGDSLAEHMAVVLVQLVFEGQQWGLSLLPFPAALHRLAADWPPLLAAHLPLLACCLTTAGEHHTVEKKIKDMTTPFSIVFTRSLVIHQAAQSPHCIVMSPIEELTVTDRAMQWHWNGYFHSF